MRTVQLLFAALLASSSIVALRQSTQVPDAAQPRGSRHRDSAARRRTTRGKMNKSPSVERVLKRVPDTCFDSDPVSSGNPFNVTNLDILINRLLTQTDPTTFDVPYEGGTTIGLEGDVKICAFSLNIENDVTVSYWEAGWAASYIAHRDAFVSNGENCCPGGPGSFCAGGRCTGHDVTHITDISFTIQNKNLDC